jgi:putative transposase
MGRRLRKIIPGLPYHLTHRGNHRSPILDTDERRAMYVSIMIRWQIETGVRIAAFVIMPNHVHFIVESPTPDAISKWIANGHREYSKWLNTTRSTTGHNWEERYFAVLMDPEHCLNALRYVEQNPVAAGLSACPWDWHWSSAPFHAGFGHKPVLLNHDLRPEGTSPATWREALLQPTAADFRSRLHECAARGTALGDESWARCLEAQHSIDLLPKRRGRKPLPIQAPEPRFGRRRRDAWSKDIIRTATGDGATDRSVTPGTDGVRAPVKIPPTVRAPDFSGENNWCQTNQERIS